MFLKFEESKGNMFSQRHRHIPKYILNKKEVLHVKKLSKHRKLRNMELNSKPGAVEYKAERKDKIYTSHIINN
jgi:hypothetical protein